MCSSGEPSPPICWSVIIPYLGDQVDPFSTVVDTYGINYAASAKRGPAISCSASNGMSSATLSASSKAENPSGTISPKMSQPMWTLTRSYHFEITRSVWGEVTSLFASNNASLVPQVIEHFRLFFSTTHRTIRSFIQVLTVVCVRNCFITEIPTVIPSWKKWYRIH